MKYVRVIIPETAALVENVPVSASARVRYLPGSRPPYCNVVTPPASARPVTLNSVAFRNRESLRCPLR